MIMRRIVYSGGELITTGAVSEAVLAYAAELGNSGRAVTIFVPAIHLPAGATDVELLIGPASQLTAEPVEVDVEPLDDRAFFRQLADQHAADVAVRPWSEVDWDLDV